LRQTTDITWGHGDRHVDNPVAVRAAILRALEVAPLDPGWNSGAVNVGGRWYIYRVHLSIGGNSRGDVFPMVTEPRQLSSRERRILERIFSQLPRGRDELRSQLHDAEVSTIDEEGSTRFLLHAGDPASSISDRVPVTGIYEDKDGVPIYLLLHVVAGKLRELEVYKADGSRIISRPDAEKLHF
jgi:hypothetical protein